MIHMQTNYGTIIVELFPDKAPKTVANFLQYVKDGFYNGTIFHRIIDGFMIQTGGFGPGLTALASGGIDAAPLIDPILTLQPQKYQVVFTFADLIPQVTWLVGVATREFAEKQPEKLRKLIQVRRKGVDFIYANRAEAAAIYAEVWQQKPEDVARFFPKYFDMPGEWSPGDFNKGGLEKMSAGLQLIGDADKPIDWMPIIDQRFLPKDLQRPL